MKKLLIISILGMLLTASAGCRFLDCLWRGGPTNQTCQPAAVACPNPCATYSPGGCDPCSAPAAVTTTPMTPQPDPTYVPTNR
jgi:hypothetical protein